jgi:hypothetical protein
VAPQQTLAEVLVKCERHVALRAFLHFAALDALDEWRISAPVLEDDDLLVLGKFFAYAGYKRVGKVAVHLFAVVLTLEVNHGNERHLQTLVTFSHADHSVFALFCVEACLD